MKNRPSSTGRVKSSVIIVGGGSGRRMGSRTPKALLNLRGLPLYMYCVKAFAAVRAVAEIVLVLPSPSIEREARRWGRALARLKVAHLVGGGATRHDSMRVGLALSDPRCEVVMIHDAARPFVSGALIRRVAREAARSGAALPALQPPETAKQQSGRRLRTLDRGTIWLAQTPQGFRSDKLRRALARLGRRTKGLTDDVQLFERLGWPVALVEGDPANEKITYARQLFRAQRRKG